MRAVLLSTLVLAACSSRGGIDPQNLVDVPAAIDLPRDAAADAAPRGDQPAAVCVVGRTKACPCADGRSGAQTCGADGTYGPCGCFQINRPTIS